jgi:hypothetical protein
MATVAPACLGTADDAPTPLQARIAASGVDFVRASLPMPACWISGVDVLAIDRCTALTDPELARQVGLLLDARHCVLGGSGSPQ